MIWRSSVLVAAFGCLLFAGCGGGSSSGTASGGSGGAAGGGAGGGGAAGGMTGGSGGTTSTTGGEAGTGGAAGAPNVCGDGVALGDEECDGADLKSGDCTLYGYSTKQGLSCDAACHLDSSGCMAACDGALREPGEECDGADLGNHDCTEFGFTNKAGAKCNATCSGVEIGDCGPTCDGAALEMGEECDGMFLDGKTCNDFGFDAAAGLSCSGACELSTAGCKPTCDGAKREPGEACDGADLGAKTCADFGFVSPAGLSCDAMCALDQAGCMAACGNGVKEPGEACDGAAPLGEACTAGCALRFTTVINEVLYDPPGTDSASGACYIELRGDPGLDLTGYSLKFTRDSDGMDYVAPLKLDAQSIGANGYFVVVQTAAQQAGLPAGTSSLVSGKADMNNGPNSVLLLKGTAVVDALGYGTFSMNFQGEGAAAPDPSNVASSLARIPDGSDTNNNGVDFKIAASTPGGPNMP